VAGRRLTVKYETT